MRANRIPRPELLAPAGGPDALRAAVANGADAVYLGAGELNARRGARNFSVDELSEAVVWSHLRNVKVYLTTNVVVLPEEMSRALALVDEAWAAGVDAVIVQDLGLLTEIRRALPEVRLHASTQLNTHNAEGVEALSRLGVSRVTLARETSVDEIAALALLGVEVESFVHGSLCVCYSGQCLLSSMVGGRSANRGLCTQPCRLAYRLVDEAGEIVAAPGRYLLSAKDLAGIAVLPRLLAAGASALKIEGRMKGPEYVALVTGIYRAAIDRASADPEAFQVSPAEWQVLEEAFNRGFTEAYLSGGSGAGMMSYTRPNDRGVPVGRVVSTGPGAAVISLDRAIETGDRLEFWTRGGRSAVEVVRPVVDGREVHTAPAGERVGVRVDHPVSRGDRVFRVANAALLKAARRTYAGEVRDVPVDARVRVSVGEPLEVALASSGSAALALGGVVEEARTKPITAEEVTEHVGRLGGTPYRLDGIALEIDLRAGLAYSALHDARRRAASALDEERLAPWAHRRARRPASSAVRATPRPSSVGLVVAVADMSSVDAARGAGASEVLLAVDASCDPSAFPCEATPLLPRAAHDEETAMLLAAARRAGSAVCGNLGLLESAGRDGVEVQADWALNATNQWAVGCLSALGARFVWLSPELSRHGIASVAAASPVPVGMVVHGRLELMVSENCVLAAAGCDRDCADCRHRRQVRRLRDRMGYEFPVRSDPRGRSHLYNSLPIDLSRVLPEVVSAGVARVRLDLMTETPDEVARLTRGYLELLDAASPTGASSERCFSVPSTTGHFFRGVR